MNEEDAKVTIPPGVCGNVSGTLKISVDQIYWIDDKPSENDYFVQLTWWGGKNHHYFYPENINHNPLILEGKNDIIFQIRTSKGLFETYLLNCKHLDFHLKSSKSQKIIGTARVKCYDKILSLKPSVSYYPVLKDKKRIADLCIGFQLFYISDKLSTDIEEEYGFVETAGTRRSKSIKNTNKVLEKNGEILSNIISKGQELRKAMVSSVLASCDFPSNEQFEEYRNNMPCHNVHETKSEEKKIVDYLMGKEMTKEEEEEALNVLRCKSPLPSLHEIHENISEPKSVEMITRNLTSDISEIQEEIPKSSDIEFMSSSKEALIKSYAKAKRPLDCLVDSYRIGVECLILTNNGLKKIFNIPDYIPPHLCGKLPSGTTFILEYHSVSTLRKQWTRPSFSITAKYYNSDAVKFNEFVIKKLKPSPNPWEQVRTLCSGSLIKIYCKHSNERQSFMLAETEYPSSINTGYSRKFCLPLFTRYKLHIGNLLLKVDLGIGTIFGDDIIKVKENLTELNPCKIVPRTKKKSEQEKIIFESMSEDEQYANKRPFVLSKNAVGYYDIQPKEPLIKSKNEQIYDKDILESKLENLTNNENKCQNSKQDNMSSITSFELLESESNIKTNYCGCCCCRKQCHQNKTKKDKDCRKCQTKQLSMQWKDEVAKPEMLSKITKHNQKHKCQNSIKDPIITHLYNISIYSCEAIDAYSKGKREFFLSYDFPIVDSETETVRFPPPQQQSRIELDGSNAVLKHSLILNSLNDQLRSLPNDYITFKLYARCYKYKSFKLLIGHAKLPLRKLVEWEASYRYKYGDSMDNPPAKFIVPLRLDIESNLPTDFDEHNFRNLNIQFKYQRKVHTNDNLIQDIKTKPKEQFDDIDEIAVKIISKKNIKKGCQISQNDSVLQTDSLSNWRDQFKEPVISKDPITGELKSSRIENQKEQSFTDDDYWGSKSLEIRHNFSDEQMDSTDFIPASHPPSFIEPSISKDLPEYAKIVDITSDENFNDNPFESSNTSKEKWKNQVESSESDKISTNSSHSDDIFKNVRKKKIYPSDRVKKHTTEEIFDLEKTNFEKFELEEPDYIEIIEEIKSPLLCNKEYEDQNYKITTSKISKKDYQNPFEYSNISKEKWKNQGKSSQTDNISTSSSRSCDIFKNERKNKYPSYVKKPTEEIIDLEKTNFEKFKQYESDYIEIIEKVKSPFKKYEDQNDEITMPKIIQKDLNLPSTSKIVDRPNIDSVSSNHCSSKYNYVNLNEPIVISDDEYTQDEIGRFNKLLNVDDKIPKAKIKKNKCRKHGKKTETHHTEIKNNSNTPNSRPSTGRRKSKRLINKSDEIICISDISTPSAEKPKNELRRSKRLLDMSAEKNSILHTTTPSVENQQAKLATEQEQILPIDQFLDKEDTRVSIDTQTMGIDWSRSSIVTVAKSFSARIDIERAVNLLSGSLPKKIIKDNEPSSYVTIYAETKGQASCLNSHTVFNDRNPEFNVDWTVRLASEMLYLPHNELEILVVVDLNGDRKALKASIDLTTISAGLSCIDGWYTLTNGSEFQGHLKVKITPLEDISVYREIWSKAIIVNFDGERKTKDHHINHLENQLVQYLQQKVDRVNKLSDQLEYKIANPSVDNYSVEFLEEIDQLNQELKNDILFKQPGETENNLILDSKSLINSPLNDLINSTDADNTNRIITIDDSDELIDDYFNVTHVETLFEAIPKDNLQVASDAIEKLIQELKNQRINND